MEASITTKLFADRVKVRIMVKVNQSWSGFRTLSAIRAVSAIFKNAAKLNKNGDERFDFFLKQASLIFAFIDGFLLRYQDLY